MVPIFPSATIVMSTLRKAVPGMPTDLMALISGYAREVDYLQCALIGIQFDEDGNVTNPAIRNAFKEAFISSDCSSRAKSALLRRIYSSIYLHRADDSHLWQAEIDAIFDEIAESGYIIQFDGVDLSNMFFMNLNWVGIRLKGADMSNLSLIGIDMSNADLTGAKLDDGDWVNVKVDNATLTGASLDRLRVREQVGLQPLKVVELGIEPR